MKREYVKSHSLRSVGYDLGEKTLEVEFHNGAVYQYYDVPKSMVLKFAQAASKGRFFNLYIKDHYDWQQVAEGRL